jgi:predicted transcriptional regulator
MVLTQADINVNEAEFRNLRAQKLDKDGEVTVEYLERKVVPLLSLYTILQGYEKRGINVCARLWYTAYGIYLAQKLRTELV